MIKVVATKKKANQPKKIQCCVCQSELEYMQNDVENGKIECPVFGVKNDEQTSIFVCKNYWEDSYDFQ